MPRTGDRRKRVAVQKATKSRGSQGGFTFTWATENEVWAKINPLSAQERIDVDQVQNVRSHRVTMRFYSPGITGEDRLLFDSRIFNIVSVVDPGERGCFTILDVKEAEVV